MTKFPYYRNNEIRASKARLENFKGSPDKKTAVFIGILISVVSLLISGMTAYRAIFYQKDHLRFAVTKDDFSFWRNKEHIPYKNKITALLMNEGNTVIVISRITNFLSMRKDRAIYTKNCEEDKPLGFIDFEPTSFKALSIKPGESAAIDLEFSSEDSWAEQWSRSTDKGGYKHFFFCSALRLTVLTGSKQQKTMFYGTSEYAVVSDDPRHSTSDEFWGETPSDVVLERRYVVPF